MNPRALRGRNLGLTAIVVTAALVATGCGGGDQHAAGQSPKKTIFVFDYFPHSILPGTWAWYNGYQKAAAELGSRFNVVVKDESSLDVDPGQFLNFIKTSMVAHPDGVVVVPNNSAGMASGLRQLQAQYPKTTFVAMDQTVPGWTGASTVRSDDRNVGREAASWLLQQFNEHKLASPEVAIFKTPPGSLSQDERTQGFLAGIKGSPLTVVKTVQSSDASNATALKNMLDVLTAHPQLGGVFSATDDFGLGVAQALVKANKLGVADVSVDADPNAVRDIIDGKGMNADIGQDFKQMGYLAVRTLADALDGKSVQKEIVLATPLITAANARQSLNKINADATPSK